MKTSPIKGQSGFSLIELMVVLALSAILLGGYVFNKDDGKFYGGAGIYGLYNSLVKSAHTQEEVVEVQQNLRVAMDSIVRDIEMGGFLVPAGSNPVQVATSSTTDALTLNTASAIGIYGRITAQVTTASSTALTLESTDAVAQFSPGDSVRIIRPQDSSQPLGIIIGTDGNDYKVIVSHTAAAANRPITGANWSTYWQANGTTGQGVAWVSVIAYSPCTVTGASGTTLTLSGAATGVTLVPGDIVARTKAGGAHPNTVVYSVVTGGSCPAGQQCIARNANGDGNDIVANNISSSGLQFRYILTDNTEVDVPTDYTLVRAVRVTVTGETEKLVAQNEITGTAKPRTMTTVVSMRNK